jgi:hypothetical protein
MSLVEHGPRYDIAFSYAGEDRCYVERVAHYLRNRGVSVFYDQFELADLLGKDGYVHFWEIFSKASRYCVAFISRHYAEKLWPKRELRSAFERALKTEGYLLPARFDDTDIPGLLSTTLYADLRHQSPYAFGKLLFEKLGRKEIIRPTPMSLREQELFARTFVEALRKGLHSGPTFDEDIDSDPMQAIRIEMERDPSASLGDTEHLVAIIENDRLRAGLRNRAASLILGRRLAHDRQQQAMAREYLTNFFQHHAEHWANVESSNWLILRAVAYALASWGGNFTPMIRWLEALERDQDLLSINLEVSDIYVGRGHTSQAVEVYALSIAKALERSTNPVPKKLWEIYYIGHRAEPSNRFLELLNACVDRTANPACAQVCRSAESRLRIKASN